MQLDIKYVFLLTVFSVIVVHGKIQVLKPQDGDPKFEHFAQLHSEETSTSQQNEELPNGNDQARNDRYIRSTQLKRLRKAESSFSRLTISKETERSTLYLEDTEDRMSFRRSVRNIVIQEKKGPEMNQVAQLIRVRSNIPRGYFLDPRGRLRVIV